MVWALSLNVQMTAKAHRLDLPHHVGVLCFVQLLIASLSFGADSFNVFAMFVQPCVSCKDLAEYRLTC